jgi:SAM-dependent methyltransferase
MEQTPAHDRHNPELLKFMPDNARRVVEVGCSTGALARAYKAINPQAHYIGVEIDPAYAELARRHCDEVLVQDMDAVGPELLRSSLAADCWVFGDSLEHLRDPWALLAKIRAAIPADGCIAACIPNAQHWSVQMRLNSGEFRYEDAGLLDRTHLRWFTRRTMHEMFAQAGFKITQGHAIIFHDPRRDQFLPAIGAMATAAGADAEMAVRESLATQYVWLAVPV